MDTTTLLTYIVLPGVSCLLIPLLRSLYINIDNRIKFMESRFSDKLTETEARQLISDKLEPVKESLSDIKDKIDQLTAYLLKK